MPNKSARVIELAPGIAAKMAAGTVVVPHDDGGVASAPQGHISKARDGEVRHPLFNAASIVLTKYQGFCSLKAWGLKIAKKPGHNRACMAHQSWRTPGAAADPITAQGIGRYRRFA
jgi:hypothetical protein